MLLFQSQSFVNPFQLKSQSEQTLRGDKPSSSTPPKTPALPALSMESAEAYLRDYKNLSADQRKALGEARSAERLAVRRQAEEGTLTAIEARQALSELGRGYRLLAEATGAPNRQVIDSRLVAEGYFFSSAKDQSDGFPFARSDKSFKTRQDALAHAYHFGSDLLQANKDIAKIGTRLENRRLEISTLKDELTAGIGDSDFNLRKLAWLKNNHDSHVRLMNQMKADAQEAMASLSVMFSQIGNGLSTEENGTQNLTRFEITHGVYGKLMEVSEDGTIRMFDSVGQAYSRQEFITKQPDGMIGEIHNDLIREEDKRQRLAAQAERAEKLRNGELEGKVLHFTWDEIL